MKIFNWFVLTISIWIFSFFMFSKAFAATTGNVVITGTVPNNVSVTLTPGTVSFALATAQTNLTVVTVNESSNDPLGYKLTLSSNNAGQLKNGTLGSVAYTAQYNGVAATLSVTPQTVTNVTSQTSVVNANKNLTISTPATTNVMAGNYADTLVFTISAN